MGRETHPKEDNPDPYAKDTAVNHGDHPPSRPPTGSTPAESAAEPPATERSTNKPPLFSNDLCKHGGLNTHTLDAGATVGDVRHGRTVAG